MKFWLQLLPTFPDNELVELLENWHLHLERRLFELLDFGF